MNSNTGSGRNDTRDSLLNELESIRSLLNEPSEESPPPILTHTNNVDADIPILHDTIPAFRVQVPVLNDRISLQEQPAVKPEPIIPPSRNSESQLASVRAAAAVIAAKAVRNRDTASRTTLPDIETRKDNEKLIAAVMDELQPQLESLVRNILRKHLNAMANNPTDNP